MPSYKQVAWYCRHEWDDPAKRFDPPPHIHREARYSPKKGRIVLKKRSEVRMAISHMDPRNPDMVCPHAVPLYIEVPDV